MLVRIFHAALALIIFSAANAATNNRTNSRNSTDTTPDVPHMIKIAPRGPFHVQGIAVDTTNRHIYLSFTTELLKVDYAGNVVGSVTGMVGHLGCLAFNPDDGCVYGSLEYKNDEIGRGIRAGLKADDGGTGFYAAVFDTHRITRTDMDAEKDSAMTAVFIKEAYDDYTATTVNNGHELLHRFGCSGIDGTAIAPDLGGNGSEKFIYLAYGVYGDTARTDNDYQVLLAYSLDSLRRYALPLRQEGLHRSGPAAPARKLFIRTGNTSYGVQNLCYDAPTSRFLMAVYKGAKREFPNYGLFAIDGRATPRRERLAGFNPPVEEETLPTYGGMKSAAGVSGWNFDIGTCGLCSLGGGYFYIVTPEKGDGGRQGCTIQLYKWTGEADAPLKPVP